MIYDSWKNLSMYRGILPELDRAIRIAAELDFTAASEGKHELGEALYYIKSTMQTRDISEADFEAHRRYLDLFAVLSGEERIVAAPLETLSVTKEYNENEDYMLLRGRMSAEIVLRPGTFAICFPSDGHISGGTADGIMPVCERIVMKIPYQMS